MSALTKLRPVEPDTAASDAQYFVLDQNLNGNGSDGIPGWVYSIVQYRVGTPERPPDGVVDPDFVEGWETSPDGLTVTLKVRQGLKWDNRPPTSGRLADSADLKYSWDRWVARNSKAPSLANEKDPFAPVVSVTTPDSKTAVMKLAYPYAPLLPMLAFIFHPVMMPKEADGGFDVRNTARGSGAWLIEEYQPSTILKLRRNPNWHVKDRPYLDGWDIIILPDYAQGLAQLKAGNIDTYAVRQEDVIATKKDTPSLVFIQRSDWTKTPDGWLYFGVQPDSPFLDERVRKAFSMEIDRDTFLETFSDKAKFNAIGLPAEYKLSNYAAPGYPFYLDPRGKEMGEAAKSFEFSPAEAKKLLSAAGNNQPISFNFTVPATGASTQQNEALVGGVNAVGDFKITFQSVNFQQVFIPQYQNQKGDFKGMILLGQAESPDYDWVMYNTFYPESPNYFSKTLVDQKIVQTIDAQRRELDKNKRHDLLRDFQRYMGTKMYILPMPGQWKTFTLSQPWVGNFGAFLPWLGPSLGGAGSSQTAYTHY